MCNTIQAEAEVAHVHVLLALVGQERDPTRRPVPIDVQLARPKRGLVELHLSFGQGQILLRLEFLQELRDVLQAVLTKKVRRIRNLFARFFLFGSSLSLRLCFFPVNGVFLLAWAGPLGFALRLTFGLGFRPGFGFGCNWRQALICGCHGFPFGRPCLLLLQGIVFRSQYFDPSQVNQINIVLLDLGGAQDVQLAGAFATLPLSLFLPTLKIIRRFGFAFILLFLRSFQAQLVLPPNESAGSFLLQAWPGQAVAMRGAGMQLRSSTKKQVPVKKTD